MPFTPFTNFADFFHKRTVCPWMKFAKKAVDESKWLTWFCPRNTVFNVLPHCGGTAKKKLQPSDPSLPPLTGNRGV